MGKGRKNMKKENRLWLIIALCCMVISIIGSSLIQTAGGKVEIRKLNLVISNDDTLYAQMYIPKDATADHKLPLVVLQHGSQHNLQMQDMNMVELARRGFIVISGDALGHGSSTPRGMVNNPALNFANVQILIDYACANMDNIDTSKIGICGHSMGAAIILSTLQHYVEEGYKGGENKIAAALEIGYDPAYEAWEFDGVDGPVYADSNWGVIAGKYDEYFFRQEDTNNDPAHILESQAALNFVRQADPSAQGPVEEGKYYTGQINGKTVSRVYYQNPEIHPQNVFSRNTSHDVIEFFYNTLGTPDGHENISPDNQVWLIKQLFNLLGLIGMLLFLFPFACWIMDAVPFFSSLRADKELPPAPALTTAKSKVIYWIFFCINMLLPAALAMPVMHNLIGKESFAPATANSWFGEGSTNEIAAWALISGACILIVFLINYFVFSKKDGATPETWGIKISVGNFFKSLLLAFITFLTVYLIVFVADFFFTTDFRFWLIAMRTFNANKVLYWIAYVPAFIIFYLVNNIMVNGGNRVDGRPDWVVTLVSCLANACGIVLLLAIQYIVYINTGAFTFNAMRTHNLFPFVVLVPAATIITRKYFKENGNIYLGAFTIGMIYTMMQVTQVAMNTGLING